MTTTTRGVVEFGDREDHCADLRSMIFAYPTFHTGIEEALNELS